MVPAFVDFECLAYFKYDYLCQGCLWIADFEGKLGSRADGKPML